MFLRIILFVLSFSCVCARPRPKIPFNPFANRSVNIHLLLGKEPTLDAIPKIIHQIWVGKNKIHPECIKAMETWKRLHPDWEYKLWTDEDIDSFDWINRALFDAVENPGAKADVWRYEIINKYGGVYADVDFVCLKPLDLFHEKLKFYSGFIVKGCDYTVANGLFASTPNHPILRAVIEDLSTLDEDMLDESTDNIMEVFGQGVFTRCIKAFSPKYSKYSVVENGVYIFDSTIFYPIQPKMFPIMQHNNLVVPKALEHNLKDAYTVHLYARSWIQK